MIFGIGTDIVEVKRIRNLDSLEKFADKILSLDELEVFKSQIDEKKVILRNSRKIYSLYPILNLVQLI